MFFVIGSCYAIIESMSKSGWKWINKYSLLLYLWENRLHGDRMHVNARELSEILGRDYHYTKRLVQQMVEVGYMKAYGTTCNRYYVLTDPDKFVWSEFDHGGSPIRRDSDV